MLLIDRLSAEFDVELPSSALDAHPTTNHLVREITRLVNQRERPDLLLCTADAPTPPTGGGGDDVASQKAASAKAQSDRAARKAARRAGYETGVDGKQKLVENASKKVR